MIRAAEESVRALLIARTQDYLDALFDPTRALDDAYILCNDAHFAAEAYLRVVLDRSGPHAALARGVKLSWELSECRKRSVEILHILNPLMEAVNVSAFG